MIEDRVKTALRISHSRLDNEINATINTARAELIRSGVTENNANSDDPLIEEAIVMYCLYKMAASDNERYYEAFIYQQDCLRKSNKYMNDE